MSYVVEVNEVNVSFYSAKDARDWWQMFRLRYKDTDRITDRDVTIPGGFASVACDSKDDAEWLARHMVEHGGLNKTAVNVKRATP